MDYGRNKKIHGFSKKSHNCNPCAQHSNTYPRGLKLKRERGNPQRFPPHTPPSLRYAGVQTTKPVGNHKKPLKSVNFRGFFLFLVYCGAEYEQIGFEGGCYV